MNKNSSFGQKCSENIPVERKPYPSYQLGVNSRNWSAEYSLWTTSLLNGIRIETKFKTSNAYTLISLFCFEGQRPLVERAGLHIGKSFQIFSHLKTNQLVSFPLNFFSIFLLWHVCIFLLICGNPSTKKLHFANLLAKVGTLPGAARQEGFGMVSWFWSVFGNFLNSSLSCWGVISSNPSDVYWYRLDQDLLDWFLLSISFSLSRWMPISTTMT